MQRTDQLRTNFSESVRLQQRAHDLIPGGCHTYAKGDDQFPVNAPGFMTRGKGCHVWDVDGNEYIEYGMGCRAVTLGHGFSAVANAVAAALPDGTNFGRPAPIEVECAEQLLSMVPGADMVKFAKDGIRLHDSCVETGAAHTGRDYVACCVNHPFFATNDWFIGTTMFDAGIPQSVSNLTLQFQYNNLESVKALFENYPGRIAGLIMEPAKYDEPQDNFLHEVQRLCRENGTVFILDEMITGFRWANGGGQEAYGIAPDLSTFGKALANGFSVSALVGRREIMELGGLMHDRERVFLLSTTHGAETHSLAAAIATMHVYQSEPVIETLYRQGERLRAEIQSAIAGHGLEDFIRVPGRPCCMVAVTCGQDGNPSQEFRTLLLQETIKRGLIMPSLMISYSHTDEDVDRTIEAIDESLAVYSHALEDGVEKYLVGRPSKSVYRRFN